MSLTVEIRKSEVKNLEIVFQGKLDANSVGSQAARFFAMVNGIESDVILDFSKVTFLASLGIRMLLTAAQDVKRQGFNLKIRNTPPDIAKVLNMAGLSEVLQVE